MPQPFQEPPIPCATGPSPVCRHLRPSPSIFQRWTAGFFLGLMNVVLKKSGQPEVALTALLQFSRRLCGMQTRYQKAGSLIWPYLEGGRGIPVVLLHGYGADKDRFGTLVPFLRRSFQVIIPDLPGFGDHLPDWSLSYDIDAQVDRLEEFIRALGLNRFHLMGLSLGGYLAARYTVRFAHRILSLALMDSAGFSSAVPSDAVRLFEARGRNIFLYANEQEMEELFQFLFYRPVQLPPAVRAYWTRQGLAHSAWRRKIFDDLMAGGVNLMDEQAHGIKAPTLIVWGAQDRICHVSAVDGILAAVENCRACIIQRCGHVPIIEYPGLFRRIYLDFLEDLQQVPRRSTQ
jgi:pimeloyl-ACP methyl ester carboxylesterase